MRSPLISFICLLCLSPFLTAQNSSSSYFDYDLSLTLPDAGHIAPWELNNRKIELTAGSDIQLMPPDMALIDTRRILNADTDTLPSTNGPDACISFVMLDTFFVSKHLFLTDVVVEVPFFVDGTYEGVSSMGWEILQDAAEVQAPESAAVGARLHLEAVHPENLTLEGRVLALQDLSPSTVQDFPFQSGDIDEIRLIKCNGSMQVMRNIRYLENLLLKQDNLCRFPSVDPQVAPASAVARIQSPITVRYFEPFHATRATALAETMAWLYSIPLSDIYVEDMLPFYNGSPPVQDYLEVWFN